MLTNEVNLAQAVVDGDVVYTRTPQGYDIYNKDGVKIGFLRIEF